jgi:hypothetical protein
MSLSGERADIGMNGSQLDCGPKNATAFNRLIRAGISDPGGRCAPGTHRILKPKEERMNTRKPMFRLLLVALAAGAGLGGSAGLTTRPLHASEVEGEEGPSGHFDWAGYWWCHCGGTTCGPCSEHPEEAEPEES